MSQAVQHISLSRAHIWSRLFSPAFSRSSFCKTQRKGTRHDSNGGVIQWESVGSGRVGSGRVGSGRVGSGLVGSGRVGSGRVGSGERRSLPDSTQDSFRSTLTIVPFTVHFVLLAERLRQAVLTLYRLWKKAVMQNARDYQIYFLRVSSGATYYERGI